MAKRKCSELEHVVAGRSEQNSQFDSDNEKRAADYAELRAMLGEAVMQLAVLQGEVIKLKSEESNLKRIAAFQDETNKCFDEMNELMESMQDATASADKSAQKMRLKELLETFEAREKMMEEIGFLNDDDERLEDALEGALARYTEVQANMIRIDDLKRQLDEEQERNADLRMEKLEIFVKQLKQEPNLSE